MELGVSNSIHSFTQSGQVSIEDNNDSELEGSVTQDDDEKYTNVKPGKHKGRGYSKKVERKTKRRVSKEATQHRSSFDQIEGGEVEDEEETNHKPRVVENKPKEYYQSGSTNNNNIQRIPSISQVVPEALAAPLPRVTGMTNNQNTLPPIKTPPLSNNNSNTTLPSINNYNWRAETSVTEKPMDRIHSITIKKMEPRHEKDLKSSSGGRETHNERNSMNDEKGSNMQPQESVHSYMGYSNLNQDSDEETNYKPQKSELSSGLKKTVNDMTDSAEENSAHENEVETKSKNRLTKRPRRRSASVQRAIEDERATSKKSKKKQHKKNSTEKKEENL
jgi:hypothetical protein